MSEITLKKQLKATNKAIDLYNKVQFGEIKMKKVDLAEIVMLKPFERKLKRRKK